MDKAVWKDYAEQFKQAFNLDNSPVAVNCVKSGKFPAGEKKLRICRSILDTAAGSTSVICKENNLCFGAAWHLGFHQIKDPKVIGMIKKFVVEGEKLFSSYEALDNLMKQTDGVPDNSDSCFLLQPLEKSDIEPQLVIFVCNPDQACRILTLVTFIDGNMPRIKIGGPTCRMAIMYPLTNDEVNISFYDYTARKICNMEKDKLLVTIPYKHIGAIVDSIDKCTAGTAPIEYPPEFRQFLQKRLSK